MEPDDSILKKGLRNGEKDLYRHLFDAYYSGLVRYGSSLTGDQEAARELVQDLFLELWEKRDSIRIEGSIKSYLYSSIYHRGLNWLRAKKIREIYYGNPIEIWNWFGASGNPDHSDPLHLDIIERQITLLPDQCREVFTRSAVEGLKNPEIAAELGISVKTVENHLSRAKKILRSRLKKIR